MMFRVIGTLRRATNRLVPGWHPLRVGILRKLMMAYVARSRSEVLEVKHGFRLFIPRANRSPFVLELALYGEYEAEETRLIRSLLRSGDLAVDVGANIGYMTCLMARAVSGRPGGTVHAFEPEPDNFGVLVQNIAMNELQGVVPHRIALAASGGLSQLFLATENLGDHTLVPIAGRRGPAVQTMDFDGFAAEHCPGRQVRLVKIDVQGYESEVLRGMSASLRGGLIDTVLVEFWPARVRETGSPSRELLDFLSTVPYKISVISDTGQPTLAYPDLADRVENVEKDAARFFNLLLVRNGL